MPATPPPPINAPNSATPTPPPPWRTVFSTPDATPERMRGTVASNADVISGTDSPTPNGITTKPGSNEA